MAIYEESVAASVAILGYDMLQNATYKTSSNKRVLRAISVTGSAAVGDCKVSFRVGQLEVVAKYNGALVFGNKDDMFPVGAVIPAGMPLSAIVVDAAASNSLQIILDLI